MRRLRLFTREKFGEFSAILAGTLVFLELCDLLFAVFVYKSTTLTSIISSAINIMFDIFICSYFLKSKYNIGHATWAITALLICNYIIPLVFNGLSTIISGGLTAILSLSPLIIGVIYFIMIKKYNQNRSRKACNTMIVCGSLFLAYGVIELIIAIISYTTIFITYAQHLSSLTYVFYFIGSIFSCLTSIVSILYCVIFFIYPFVLKRDY